MTQQGASISLLVLVADVANENPKVSNNVPPLSPLTACCSNVQGLVPDLMK